LKVVSGLSRHFRSSSCLKVGTARKVSRVGVNTSTSVPDDDSQYLCCILPILMWMGPSFCAKGWARHTVGARLDVDPTEGSAPCTLQLYTVPSLVLGLDGRLLYDGTAENVSRCRKHAVDFSALQPP